MIIKIVHNNMEVIKLIINLFEFPHSFYIFFIDYDYII